MSFKSMIYILINPVYSRSIIWEMNKFFDISFRGSSIHCIQTIWHSGFDLNFYMQFDLACLCAIHSNIVPTQMAIAWTLFSHAWH